MLVNFPPYKKKGKICGIIDEDIVRQCGEHDCDTTCSMLRGQDKKI
jgi:hypothetical protein